MIAEFFGHQSTVAAASSSTDATAFRTISRVAMSPDDDAGADAEGAGELPASFGLNVAGEEGEEGEGGDEGEEGDADVAGVE
jgi:hypothetical protein